MHRSTYPSTANQPHLADWRNQFLIRFIDIYENDKTPMEKYILFISIPLCECASKKIQLLNIQPAKYNDQHRIITH